MTDAPRPPTAVAVTVPAVVAATVTRVAEAQLRRAAPVPRERWLRQNFRGREVELYAGPAVVAGAAAGALLAAGGQRGGRVAGAALLAVLGGAAAGCYDDLRTVRERERSAKGFGGHARALLLGRVTAGSVKVVGIGTCALGAALLAAPSGPVRAPGWAPGWVPAAVERPWALLRVGLDAATVAGTANLVNLLDLRPGRALKGVLLLGLALSVPADGPRMLGAAAVGTAVAALPADLGERTMIGDTGANALGALLGIAAVLGLAPVPRRVLLAAVVGLTAASERVSFSAVIEGTPALRWLDQLGRAGNP